MRGRFFLRMIVLMAIMFTLACGAFTVFYALAGHTLGVLGFPRDNAPGPLSFLGFIVLIAGLLLVGRALGRVALPIGDLMGAAGRVAEGDYSVRVSERGPREVRSLSHAFNSMAERLQMNDEQRRNLLADVTHELRTPLSVIQGNLEGLLDGVYPRDDAHLSTILEETRVLSRLIDDLRTLALAESGALVLQKESIDPAVLVGETLASFRTQADAAGIDLHADTPPDLPAVNLDPARIRQVLDNLIANALRFTPRGGEIRVECSLENENLLSVAVSDTGAGIAPEALAHIFDRFFKSSDSRGTGLGLTIAKNLVAAHGGEIHAESEIGKGTSIRFTLPLG